MQLENIDNISISAQRRRFMQSMLAAAAVLTVGGADAAAETQKSGRGMHSRLEEEPRLTFQSGADWSPHVNVNTKSVMVYGTHNLPPRLREWRKAGYATDMMTAAAWGTPADFIDGRWDGVKHHEDVQKTNVGHTIQHGPNIKNGYIVPTPAYGKFLSEVLIKAAKTGMVGAIFLEEPEFWISAGYSEGFKRQWREHYHDQWQAPGSSPAAQYKASKLKYFLYGRLLKEVGRNLRRLRMPFYVATHSLLNYFSWAIVSPESSLVHVPCDGYIAQVWTGTARIPNVYEGRLKTRTFETAFFEFGVFQNFVRGPGRGRKLWFLADPVSDNPNHTWADYRKNWQDVVTASLLHPDVYRYEVMPWPERVFGGKYLSGNPKNPGERVTIPPAYATELQATITALGDMKQPAHKVRWQASGTTGIGVLVSDTMLFQRGVPGGADIHLGSFYGLAMPLLMSGIPAEPVQIEYSTSPGYLDPYKVLMLTYEGQKPPTEAFHRTLVAWIKAGGALVMVDNDKDVFNKVQEWWNSAPMHYATPRDQLFELLGVPADKTGLTKVGKGYVLYEPLSPAGLTYEKTGADTVRKFVRQAAAAVHLRWKTSPALILRRGPYVIASGLDSPPSASSTAVQPAAAVKGRFVSLLDPGMPAVKKVEVRRGTRHLLVDIDALPRKTCVIAAACRIAEEHITARRMQFKAIGVESTPAIVCIKMPRRPSRVEVAGRAHNKTAWHYSGGILRVKFPNAASGVKVDIDY